MKKIFWVTSFPKSGNTWVRAILSSLFFSEDGNFSLSLLKKIINFDIPDNYQFVRSFNVDDFNKLNQLHFISKYWLEAQRRVKVSGDFSFFKTHSGNVTLNNFKYTNTDNVLGFIYIVRDPRDVVVSYSKHFSSSIDESIQSIANKNLITWTGHPKDKFYPVLMSSWDIHYKSWKILKVPKLIIKYETLLNETRKTLNQMIDFFSQNYGFNFKNTEMKIDNILETTSFKNLHSIEKKQGFIEAPYFHSKKKTAEYFFRKGTNGQWKEELTSAQVKKIEHLFEPTMRELSYLK